MTALVHMAAARPGGIADARVPCPLCGGLIHPVAGRCKHCKEDLSAYRSGRPAAAAALPSLHGKPMATNGTNGHATAVPIAVETAIAREGSQPILPPRPTARPMTAAKAPSMWRSWPVIVIALAAVAIVTATVIMIMPPGSKNKAQKEISPPPAPERMDTSPLPEKQSQIDPWQAPDDPDQNPPGAYPKAAPQPAPAPDDDADLLSPLDKNGVAGAGAQHDFMLNALDHACKKMTACPGIDQSLLAAACSSVSALPKAPPKANCPAAQKCLDAIDHMSCGQMSAANASTIVNMVQDCATAMQC